MEQKNQTELCVKCQEKPIFVKKRKLCKNCAHRFYIKRIIGQEGSYPYSNKQNKHEMEFVKQFFTHNNWLYQPAIFRVNSHNYEPDFYDGERNVFIEVAGTYQAFYQNRKKYIQFCRQYPKINFEIRTPKGSKIEVDENNIAPYPCNERKQTTHVKNKKNKKYYKKGRTG